MGIEQAIADAEAALRESARRHKRLEREHREAARASMQALAALRSTCEALGIELVIAGTEEVSKP